MKRRVLLFGLSFAALALAASALAVLSLTPRPRVTAESIRAVEAGLTRQQVESVFAVPPGDYTTPGARRRTPVDPNGRDFAWHAQADWLTDHASVRVYFDAQDRVLFTSSVVRADPPETFWDRVRRRLGL